MDPWISLADAQLSIGLYYDFVPWRSSYHLYVLPRLRARAYTPVGLQKLQKMGERLISDPE